MVSSIIRFHGVPKMPGLFDRLPWDVATGRNHIHWDGLWVNPGICFCRVLAVNQQSCALRLLLRKDVRADSREVCAHLRHMIRQRAIVKVLFWRYRWRFDVHRMMGLSRKWELCLQVHILIWSYSLSCRSPVMAHGEGLLKHAFYSNTDHIFMFAGNMQTWWKGIRM